MSLIDENEMNSVYAKLLFSIKQHGENLAEALNAVYYHKLQILDFLMLSAGIKFSEGPFPNTKILCSCLSGFNLEPNRLQAHCKVQSEVDYRRSGL